MGRCRGCRAPEPDPARCAGRIPSCRYGLSAGPSTLLPSVWGVRKRPCYCPLSLPPIHPLLGYVNRLLLVRHQASAPFFKFSAVMIRWILGVSNRGYEAYQLGQIHSYGDKPSSEGLRYVYSPEHERRAIIEYWERERQSPDDEAVEHAEKIHTEVLTNGRRYDVWDVHATDGQWWVITKMTNLYPKEQFPTMDHALNQHIGLIERVIAKDARAIGTKTSVATIDNVANNSHFLTVLLSVNFSNWRLPAPSTLRD